MILGFGNGTGDRLETDANEAAVKGRGALANRHGAKRPGSVQPMTETVSPPAAGTPAALDGERRQATVLFADMEGYTALAVDLYGSRVATTPGDARAYM